MLCLRSVGRSPGALGTRRAPEGVRGFAIVVRVVTIGLVAFLATADSVHAQSSSTPPIEANPEVLEKPIGRDAFFFEYSVGFSYSRGDYGLDRDSILYYVPLGITVDYGHLRMLFFAPLLYSDGLSSTVGTVRTSDGQEAEHNAGLGEVVTGASYLFEPVAEGLPWIEVGGQILWPTRTDPDLGTGNFGFATQLDVFQTLGRWTPFATFGRSYYLVSSVDDRFFTSVGASFELSSWASFGLAYDWLEATGPGLSDAHELIPFLSIASGDEDAPWRIGPYGVIGLSDGSPDYGFGVSLRYAP